jgi:hypothetical protein
LRIDVRIQINSDKNIVVDAQVTGFVETEVNRVLTRFIGKLTRVEVHLSDANSDKFGEFDKRCLIEARPAGHRPLAASDRAPTTEQAVRSALGKLRSSLQTFFGRLGKTPGTPGEKQASKRAVTKATKKRASKPATNSATQRAIKKVAAPKKKAIYQARRKGWPRGPAR